MVRNPYRVLGVSPECSKEEAKLAYRRLVKIYHPDGSNGDIKKFLEIKEAWKLIEAQKDKIFNRKVSKLTHKTLFTFRRI